LKCRNQVIAREATNETIGACQEAEEELITSLKLVLLFFAGVVGSRSPESHMARRCRYASLAELGKECGVLMVASSATNASRPL
jgi:hypothetical protein